MPRPGHVIALCVFALLCLGAVMVQSAAMSAGAARPQPFGESVEQAVTFKTILLSRQTLYMALSLVAMAAASRVPALRILDARRLGPRSWVVHPVLLLGVAALLAVVGLVYVPGVGRSVNGSERWLNLPVFGSVQPSEFAKWGLVIVLAFYAAWKGPVRMGRWGGLLPGLALAGLVSAVVIKEDLGTGALMLGASAIVLLAGGGSFWRMACLAPPALAGLAAAVFTSEYRMERVRTFLDPFKDPDGAGYHMIQSMVAVANGQVFGRGLGFGLQKFGYLPEDKTDFLFAVICEELGIAGAGVVVALYLGILWAGLSIVRRIPAHAGAARLVAIGVLATLGLQAVINMGVVTGLGPTKGIALPLLSSGGTGWILTAFSLGLLIALDRECGEEEGAGLAVGMPVVAST